MKRIAWCTPFSAASAISEFSHSLIECHNSDQILNSESKIDILVNDNGHRYRSSSKCYGISEILKSSDSVELFSDHYDHVFYNLGNNKENHQEIFELSRRIPGVAILHDYVYQHYFAGRIFSESKSPDVYAYLMGRHYGATGLASVYASQITRSRQPSIGLWDTDLTSEFPLIEAVVANPLHKGVVVHSEMGRRTVEKAYDGPILQLRLPGDYVESPTLETCAKWRDETARRRRVTIGVIGHIQRAKQIHRLIDAILDAPHIAECVQTVIIAGKPSDKEYVVHLQRIISQHPFGSIIRLELSVSHERLQEIKEAADFFFNMRYPNTEGGSGSLIEQMACNKPVIVLNSGIFSEVSSGVIKIDNIDDKASLQRAVYDLASKPLLRIELGDKARVYALNYLCKNYAKDIINFSNSITTQRHHSSQLNIHEILQYDVHTRGPEPLFSWPIEAFSEFAKILFQHHFENEFIDSLISETRVDPISAYKIYSFARTLLDFFQNAEQAQECKTWLFPVDFDCKNCYTLAYLKEKHYHSLAKIFAHFNRKEIRLWTTVINRFSTKTPQDRYALQMSIWKNVIDDTRLEVTEGLHRLVINTIPVRFTDLVRLVATLSDDDFIHLLLGSWRPFFDSKEYQNTYLDLREKPEFEHETLAKHFEMHGRQEGRIAKASSQSLIRNLKNSNGNDGLIFTAEN